MTGSTTFVVLRAHQGDRRYSPGDMRRAVPVEVAHLARNGVLRLATAEEAAGTKAAPEFPNKAEKAAPINRAENGRKARG